MWVVGCVVCKRVSHHQSKEAARARGEAHAFAFEHWGETFYWQWGPEHEFLEMHGVHEWGNASKSAGGTTARRVLQFSETGGVLGAKRPLKRTGPVERAVVESR